MIIHRIRKSVEISEPLNSVYVENVTLIGYVTGDPVGLAARHFLQKDMWIDGITAERELVKIQTLLKSYKW